MKYTLNNGKFRTQIFLDEKIMKQIDELSDLYQNPMGTDYYAKMELKKPNDIIKHLIYIGLEKELKDCKNDLRL